MPTFISNAANNTAGPGLYQAIGKRLKDNRYDVVTTAAPATPATAPASPAPATPVP